MQAWPVGLAKRDAVAIAKTGSGKTAGFMLPGLLHIREHRSTRQYGDAPLVLVVAPTRELACQIEEESNKYCKPCGVRVKCVYGGVPRGDQIRGCREGTDILIATPGRLLDFEGYQQVSLKLVSYVPTITPMLSLTPPPFFFLPGPILSAHYPSSINPGSS